MNTSDDQHISVFFNTLKSATESIAAPPKRVYINIAYPEITRPMVKINDLASASALIVIPNFLETVDAKLLEDDFQFGGPEHLKLHREPNRRNPHQPCKRSTVAYADDRSLIYTYSVSRHTDMEPMPSSIQVLRKNIVEFVQANTGVFPNNYSSGKRTFDDTPTKIVDADPYYIRSFALKRPNYCLVNYYPDGDAGIGMHSDNPKDMELLAPIYSYSLGARRTLDIRKIGDAATVTPVESVPMEHNSLVIMSGAFQSVYTHEVPSAKVKKYADEKEPRINFTFRFLTTPTMSAASLSTQKRKH